LIFVGVDWAEAYHDVHVEDEAGRRLGGARLPEGVDGIARFHEPAARHAPALITMPAAPPETPTIRPCAPWVTGSSAFSTAASLATPSTARNRLGPPHQY
jgi:hypothetical protein